MSQMYTGDGRARSDKVLAWHFVSDRLRDGREIPADGEVLRHDGEMKMCASGLHASVRCADALNYAPGHTLCRVECSGDLAHAHDKLICRERVIVSRIDATPMLRAWARWCALQVIHLWNAPDIVREYLTTGDESKRAAAGAAAWRGSGTRAARAAAMAAAGAVTSATWAAAEAASWTARAAAVDAQSAQLDLMAEEAMAGRTEWVWEVPEVSDA
jgi:hypothetical protein